MPLELENIEISEATEADFDFLQELRAEALLYHPEAYTADPEMDRIKTFPAWKKKLRKKSAECVFVIAKSDSQPVGMAAIFRGMSSKTIHTSTLEMLYVRPSSRKNGVAKQLIERCIQWSRKHKIKIIKLGVTNSNLSAIQFYDSCGFRIYGIEPKSIFYEGVFYNDLLMAREL